jgi:hypothetical protein
VPTSDGVSVSLYGPVYPGAQPPPSGSSDVYFANAYDYDMVNACTLRYLYL